MKYCIFSQILPLIDIEQKLYKTLGNQNTIYSKAYCYRLDICDKPDKCTTVVLNLPPEQDDRGFLSPCCCECTYMKVMREGGQQGFSKEGVRCWRRIYNSWPNRICCCLAGLGMLKKESIYCCQLEGPLAWVGDRELGGGWVRVRWGWGGSGSVCIQRP